jgi:2-methylcitrate dehydratase PrpD
MEESLTERLAQVICQFQGAALPPAAIAAARLAVLDCVGVALAGSREPVSAIVRELAAPAQEATIWGTRQQTTVLDAALVNGTMSHAMDYDDMNRSVLGHPSAVIVPALLALAENGRLSGRRVLEGYVVGLEAMARVGRIFGIAAYEKCWHPTAIFGVIASCATTAYVLRLEHEQLLHALGIAASEAAGIKKNFGSMTKPYHAGSAARKGLWAALAARRGMTADQAALDGKFGYLDMFNGTPNVGADGGAADGIEILRHGLVYKMYPCCGGLHAQIDNMLELSARNRLQAKEVADIECRAHPDRVAYLDRPRVSEGLEAKFSIQYCVATALLDGAVGASQFSEAAIGRESTRALMSKIRLTADREVGGFGSQIIVRTTDGREFAQRMASPKGSADSPFSEAELLAKFVDCASTVMSVAAAEQAGASWLALDQAADAGALVRMLRTQ